jgi:hypothetical protein
MVVPGELFGKPTLETREPVEMQGVAHLGLYVHEMTQQRQAYDQGDN